MNKIILGTNAPGLGDQLQFSTLPEEFSKLGYEFYLSNKIPFRNLEIKQLVWGCNPFIKGESDLEPNAGEEIYCNRFTKINRIKNNYIDVIEGRHGIISENKYPKIYYKFNEDKFQRFKNSIIFDLDSMTNFYYFRVDFNKKINEVIETFKEKEIILIQHKYSFNKLPFKFNRNFDIIYNVKDIFDYCDIINVCEEFVCLASGSNVLASAIKNNKSNPKINTLFPLDELNKIKESKGYYFENCNFIPIVY